MELNMCACMGIAEGDEYCYCQLKSRGMDTSKWDWTEEEKKRLFEALTKYETN